MSSLDLDLLTISSSTSSILLNFPMLLQPQIDLVTADQEAREKMWAAADGSREIPQLHVDGKVRSRMKKKLSPLFGGLLFRSLSLL